MSYSYRQRLRPLSTFQLGILFVCQQMIQFTSGTNYTYIDMGNTVTHIVSKDFRNIYIGGINFVAQLSSDLDLLHNLTTGPVKTAEHCAPYPAPCDNHIRALEIDKDHNMLLVCGSAYNGTCTLHNLDDICLWSCLYAETTKDSVDIMSGIHQKTVLHFLDSTTIHTPSIPIDTKETLTPLAKCRTEEFGRNVLGMNNSCNYSARIEFSSTVKPPSRMRVMRQTTKDVQNQAMPFQSNLMVALNMQNSTSSNSPLVSLRYINFVGRSHYTIGYTRAQNSQPIGLNAHRNTPPSMIPDYKMSFTWGNYSYFLFLQEISECEKSSPCIVTKISRTCHGPSSILPYVELTLSCEHMTTGRKYRLLSAATLGQVGLQLETSYVTIPVLVMTFGNGSEPLSKKVDPIYGTAICAVTLDFFDKVEFPYNLDTCDDATDHVLVRHVDWISGKNQYCQNESKKNGTCTSNTKNQYVQSIGFTEIPAVTYKKDISVVSILTHTHTVATDNNKQAAPMERMDVFLLASTGHLKKFSLRAKRVDGIFITDPEQILTDFFYLGESASLQSIGITDHSRAVMYIASGSKITELDLESCLRFSTCAICREHSDICRWCPKTNNCRERELAQTICQGAVVQNCPPKLCGFSPTRVPTAGGTVLTLFGAHLGIQNEGTVNVTVCDMPCANVIANDHNVTCIVPQQCQQCDSRCKITITISGQRLSEGSTSSSYLPQQTVLEYVKPDLTSFSPTYGPMSGGTILTFQGQNFTMGSTTRVSVGSANCVVTNDRNTLKCRIVEDSLRKPHAAEIKISIDNFKTAFLKENMFQFRQNPIIYSMKPMETIESGGVTITVNGSNLDSVASPLFILRMSYIVKGSNTTENFRSTCSVTDRGRNMTCKTPDVRALFDNTKNNNMTVTFGSDSFDLISNFSEPRNMTVHQNPMFFTITGDIAYISQDVKTYILKGTKIPYWIDRSDIKVTIGNVTLAILDVTSNTITCDVTGFIETYANSNDERGQSHTDNQDSGDTDNRTTTVPLPTKTSVVNTTTKLNVQTTSGTLTKSSTRTFTKAPTRTTTRTTARATTRPSTRASIRISTKAPSGTPRKPLQLLSAYSSSNNYNVSDYGTNNTNPINYENAESLIDDSGNITRNNTSMSTRTDVSRSATYSQTTTEVYAIKYNIRIEIGNYKENLGYVMIKPNSRSQSMSTSANNGLPLIIGAGGSCVVFLILVVVSCVMYSRAKKARAIVKEQAFYMGSLSGSQHGSKEGAIPSLKQILQSVVEPDQRADLDKLIISLDLLTVGKTIGSGNFGCVFEGFLSAGKDSPAEKVAVKTLQDPSSHNIDLRGFVQEAVIMREFQHPHVLGLIGLAEKEPGIPYVILPYMNKGDLLTYIRDSSVSLTLHDVISFGADIASGMAYLSALKFVHRDLAARNCMLDELGRVKVADFGLCRDIYEKGYYTSDNRKKLPIRWMAVESIEHGAYSSKSDVWSLGVVLWELLSRGVTPYPGVNGWDVINYLRQRRLAPPHFCPDVLYNLMMQCWAKDPNFRPEFSTIQTDLLGMIGQSPTITDTMKRRRNNQTYNNLPVKNSTATKDFTSNTEYSKDKTAPTIIENNIKKGMSTGKNDSYPEVLSNQKEADNANLDFDEKKKKIYSNLSLPSNTVINNVLIVIPTCYAHRDVSKTAAGVYIQLVDNYEPAPKFSNPLLRSIKKHSKKSKDRHTKGIKNDDPKTDNSGYSFPGEYPPMRNSIGDIVEEDTDTRSKISEANAHNRCSKEKSYYELETTSLRSSAASESRSGLSTLNNTGSSASILDIQSRDSSNSNSRASATSSLALANTVPHFSAHGIVNKTQRPVVPERSTVQKKQ